MQNPFATPARWQQTAKWGQMPINTPIMPVLAATATPIGGKMTNGAGNAKPAQSPSTWKRYVIPMVIIIGTLIAVAIVAIIIIVIRNRNRSARTPSVNKVIKRLTIVWHVQEFEAAPPYPEEAGFVPALEVAEDERLTDDQLASIHDVAAQLGIRPHDVTRHRPTTRELMEAASQAEAEDDRRSQPRQTEPLQSEAPIPEPLQRMSDADLAAGSGDDQVRTVCSAHRVSDQQQEDEHPLQRKRKGASDEQVTAAYLTGLLEQVSHSCQALHAGYRWTNESNIRQLQQNNPMDEPDDEPRVTEVIGVVDEKQDDNQQTVEEKTTEQPDDPDEEQWFSSNSKTASQGDGGFKVGLESSVGRLLADSSRIVIKV
jgi:hypothetical protein